MIKRLLSALIGTASFVPTVSDERIVLAITTPEYRRVMAQWSAIDRDRRRIMADTVQDQRDRGISR